MKIAVSAMDGLRFDKKNSKARFFLIYKLENNRLEFLEERYLFFVQKLKGKEQEAKGDHFEKFYTCVNDCKQIYYNYPQIKEVRRLKGGKIVATRLSKTILKINKN